MRAPISGIVTGFRMKKGSAKDSDYGVLDILQPGDAKHDSSMVFVYVEDFELCSYLLQNYANGTFRWIDVFAYQQPSGREMVWVLERIFSFPSETVTVGSV